MKEPQFKLPKEFNPRLAENFVKVSEGLRLTAYRCAAGRNTIGYGHTKGVKAGQVIDEIQAQEFLDADLKEAQKVLSRWVNKCTEGQFIALMSFVFNFGEVKFATSTLLKKHNEEDYKGAGEEFERWVYAKNAVNGKKVVLPGLVTRRREEKKQYLRDFV